MNHIEWLRGRDDTLETVSTTDRRGSPLRTVIDKRTGLVRNDPIASDEELSLFYAKNYRVKYKKAALPRKRQVLRNFRRVASFVNRNRDVLASAERILDIGAGSGEFLFTMKELGKVGCGIEPNVDYAQFCRENYGVDVKTADLKADLFESGSYDFIRLNHVLEHLNDPVRYLEMLAAWLQPNGVLQVEVPNIEEYCRGKTKGNLFHYAHIFNFNPWTLRAVAGMAGLSELPETIARNAGSTSLLLRKSEKIAPETLADEDNGARVLKLIHDHGKRPPLDGFVRKSLVKVSALISESFSTLGRKSFIDIGRGVVGSIRT